MKTKQKKKSTSTDSLRICPVHIRRAKRIFSELLRYFQTYDIYIEQNNFVCAKQLISEIRRQLSFIVQVNNYMYEHTRTQRLFEHFKLFFHFKIFNS